MNSACFAVDTDGIGYETALKVLVSRDIVNRACFAIDTDVIGCETALPVLVWSYIVI